MTVPALVPVRFAASSRELFGLFHAPAGGVARASCVVICNPFGQEAIRAHRLLRVVAERLALEGYPVLRFDYFGTGDSGGDDAAGTLSTWADDVLCADLEARRLSGQETSIWFGLRLGATLAALASAKARRAPQRLVLWDPVLDGRAYMEELLLAHNDYLRAERVELRDASVARSNDGAATEALGYPISPQLRSEFIALPGKALLEACRAATLSVLVSEGYDGLAPLPQILADRARVLSIGTRIDWASDEAMNTAIVPADALKAVIQGVSEAM